MAATSSPLIGFSPRVRQSPFFTATQRWGAKAYSTYNHMYMPLYYDSPVADYWKLVEGVTLWDVGVERQVEISGPDAARFIQYLTPRDLSETQAGQCKYVLLCDETGGIVNDPVLLKLAEDRFWLSLADSDVLLWAKGLALAGKWDVEIHEPDVSPLQVQGPKSPEVMAALFGDWIHELKYFWFRETELDGIPVVVSRTGWSSERGYEVFLRDGSRGDELWEKIMAAGAPFGIAPGAPSTIRRIEGAMLSYGSDMDLGVNPYELGLGRLVALDSGLDFIGKAALARIEKAGVSRRFCGLAIEGAPLHGGNQEHWICRYNGADCGKMTSAIYSPRLDFNMGLALLSLEAAEEGRAVEVLGPQGPLPAKVVPLPFYDPMKSLATGAAERTQPAASA
ncbi:MAG: glycine cleavage T C-terminal barrel domain-containing protein [Rhodovibrionaceae bacterium]